MKPDKHTTAIIYARYSPRRHQSTHESESCLTQIDYCERYCRLHNLEVLATFQDDGISGATIDRDALKKAIEWTVQHKAVLVVYSLSRLSRTTRDAIALADKLRAAKAGLASLAEDFNTDSAFGRFFYTIMAAMGELERVQISERTREAMRRHQANGRRMGLCPFGWKDDPNDKARMLHDEHEQKAIKKMQSLRARFMSYPKIAAKLAELGFKPRGKRWHDRTISKVLYRVERDKGLARPPFD